MTSRNAYGLMQGIVNWLNQRRAVSEDWDAPEELYGRICLDLIYKRLNGSAGETLEILDAGCGTGQMAIELAEKGHRVTGIEVHRPSVEMAQRRAAEVGVSVDVIQGDLLEKLRELPDGRFDAVLCMGVLYTCVNYREIVGEFSRVLRPGGLLFATFRPPFYFVTALLRKGKAEEALAVTRSSEAVLRLATIPCYYNWQTEDEVVALYNEHGMDVLEQRPVGVYSGAGYDGMAAVADVETIAKGSQRTAVYELEMSPGPIRGAGRFHLSTGRKR
jgi:2-polyprenyl-3-methyl-5-hydroxy-6-metoxy-1,4-benzoquinol methylase